MGNALSTKCAVYAYDACRSTRSLVRAFYQSLVARDKKKILAVCALMRIYLAGLWVSIRYCTPSHVTLLFVQCDLNKVSLKLLINEISRLMPN